MPDASRERRVLAAALGFATRLPTGWLGEPDGESFLRARSLLPVVGILVGTLGALVARATLALLGDADAAALFGVATTVILTGALHEDGLADVCDALGGGNERERVLAIMRDSRLGSFGVLGLVLSTAARIGLFGLLLAHLPPVLALSGFVASHALGRATALLAADRFASARSGGESAASSLIERPFAMGERALYLGPALVVGAFASDGPAMLAAMLVLPLALTLALGTYFQRWLGGLTGDCLGAIEQLGELVVLFVACVGAVR